MSAEGGVGAERQHLSVQSTKTEAGETSVTLTAAASRSALPEPSEVAAYERILPGSASRILTLVENERTNAQKLAWWGTLADRIAQIIGTLVGAFIVVLVGGGAFALLWYGRGADAAKVFLTGIAIVAATLFANKKLNTKQ